MPICCVDHESFTFCLCVFVYFRDETPLVRLQQKVSPSLKQALEKLNLNGTKYPENNGTPTDLDVIAESKKSVNCF